MPDVLVLKSPEWELHVWTKDVGHSRATLAGTMQVRGEPLLASCICLHPPLKISPDAEQSSQLQLNEPVFFENKLYEFEFIFDPAVTERGAPAVVHRLSAVEEAFHFNPRGHALRGSINFGNDVGWFRLGIRYCPSGLGLAAVPVTQFLSFEVLPTKLAMATDMAQIHAEIDAVYPLWRFSFAQKTEQQLARSAQRHERMALLWLAHFRQLRSELEQAVRLVMSSPHSRLLAHERKVSLNRLSGRLSPRLLEQVQKHLHLAEHHHRYSTAQRRLAIDTPENRFIKMVLQSCSSGLTSIIKTAREHQAAPDRAGRLSESFFDELTSWKKPLDQMLSQPFFDEIGPYGGMQKESLVLHQRAGYARAYRLWLNLKMYLALFGKHAAVSMKSVADLYEVWCFLQIKKMLEELGFVEQSSEKSPLKDVGLELNMVNGTSTAFLLYRAADKLRVRLSHEPQFGVSDMQKEGNIYSWTTEQRPDIFLEATFENGQTVRWIFDAKYRIWDNNGVDMAPEDAINQMHRYRDALIHIDKTGAGWKEKSRPVLGAFVLYPGWFDEGTANNPYERSIDDVGIGAFPMLPGRSNHWLRGFFQSQLGVAVYPEYLVESDKYFVEDSARISVTGTYLHHYHDLAMVAHAAPEKGRDPAYVKRFANGSAGWYHVPVSETVKRAIAYHVMQETRYCALAVYLQNEKLRVVEYLYEVESVGIARRCDLTIDQAGAISDKTEEYWLLKLGRSRPLPERISTKGVRKFVIFHTSASKLDVAKSWAELPQRYAGLVSSDA